MSVFPAVVIIRRWELFPFIADDFPPPVRAINDDLVPRKFKVFCRCFENVIQKCSVNTIKNNGLSIPSIWLSKTTSWWAYVRKRRNNGRRRIVSSTRKLV